MVLVYALWLRGILWYIHYELCFFRLGYIPVYIMVITWFISWFISRFISRFILRFISWFISYNVGRLAFSVGLRYESLRYPDTVYIKVDAVFQRV